MPSLPSTARRVPPGHVTKSSILYLHSPIVRSKDIVRLSGDPLIQDSLSSPRTRCNTPDVIYLISIPTLAVSGAKLFYFSVVGFLSPCVVVFVMHLISCHHVHRIGIRVRLMHPSFFPVVRFAFRRSYVLRWSFLPLFMCGG